MPNKIQKSINTLVWLTVPADVDKNTIRQTYQTKNSLINRNSTVKKDEYRTINDRGMSQQRKNNSHRIYSFNEKLGAGQCYLQTNQPGLQPALCMNWSSHS